MLGNSVRLFTIRGIEVGVHASWLVIFGLVTWSLASSYFPQAVPGIDAPEAWVLGAISAILLFASVLIHELAHSFVARSRGLDARSITLFIFGGVSNLAGEAKRPSTEFVVAVVGPLTSFVIAGVAYALSLAFAASPSWEAVFSYLAVINLLLGGFNLIPGFPLDGGRVLRAIAWSSTGSLRRGTEVAVVVGQIVAYGFLVWGFVRVIGSDLLGGIWIAAIGWFLQGAGQASLQQVILEQRLRRLRVSDIVRPDSTAVPADLPVGDLIEHYLLPSNRRAMPVMDDGRLAGIITLSDIRHVPAHERATTPVGRIMGGRDGLITVRPGDSLTTALEALTRGDHEQVPVVSDGQLVGMLTRADIVRQIQLREELGLESKEAAAA
jgi:Zn-dependent protease/CBS domain-containing protein